MGSTSEDKNTLRKAVLSKRADMPEADWRLKSQQITDHLLKVNEFQKASKVHIFLSMNQRKEVNTDDLIAYLFDSKKEVYVPVTNFKEGTLSHIRYTEEMSLEVNKWGVREPKPGIPTDDSDFDVIVIPMAAGDEEGNRLGYGKGFYDRFLKAAKGIKIGLCFEEFIMEEIPVGKYDVPLDIIISEKRIIYT